MKHRPFLKVVAEHYRNAENLSKYCFVFPNRRSGKFFSKFLLEYPTKTQLHPEITTISDFTADITGSIAASPIEAIFNLYEAYCAVAAKVLKEIDPFDKFIYWGNVILKDFNDIDLYDVDCKDVLRNVKDLKNISTDYLTDDIKKVLMKLFNVYFDINEENDHLFKHDVSSQPNTDDGEVKKDFTTMWDLLYDIYIKFSELMESKNLSWAGKMTKDAAKAIEKLHAEDFRYEKIVFVGFNVLSKSETQIFKGLKTKGIAEFCWDYFSPAFKNEGNKGTHFLKEYVKDFPNAVKDDMEPINEFPEIHVVGVPSLVGQAKYTCNIIDDLIKEGKIENLGNAIDTAIVMPDESLFPHLLNSTNDKITKVNATLGYPLRNSDIATLMNVVAKMHNRKSVDKESGEFTFYKDHVKDVLSHPLIKMLFGKDSLELTQQIDNANAFNIPESTFENSELKDLFKSIKETGDNDIESITQYIQNLINFCQVVNASYTEKVEAEDATKEQINENINAKPIEHIGLQSAFIMQYIDVLRDIKDAFKEYGVQSHENSVFYLINRLTGLYTVPFEGEPLQGLQMMGVLETRNLDFKNLIMLSMNERMFPRKFYSSSFIPINLRRGFHMSTNVEQESMTAYYFYRLLTRAENVYLLYDSSDSGAGSGEYSRFITQLNKVYHCKMDFTQLTVNVKPAESLKIEVKKDGEIKKRIDAYKDEKSKSYLSASSIQEYINCPLKFYLHHIEKLNADIDKGDFMDAGTFGTIVHDTLQELYYPKDKVEEGAHYIVKMSDILSFKNNDVSRIIIENVNKTYLHKEDNLDEALKGEPNIVFEALKLYVEKVLNYDIDLLDQTGKADPFFEVYECEKDEKVYLKLRDDLPGFNFNFRIDRMDKINGKGALRIVDYKTGNDETCFSDFEKLVEPKSSKNFHAPLQLLIYCNAVAELYKDKQPEDLKIQPVIYKIRDMKSSGVKFNNQQINDYQDVNEKFINAFAKFIKDFFDEDTDEKGSHVPHPFRQCNEDKNTSCAYCKFIEFCRR